VAGFLAASARVDTSDKRLRGQEAVPGTISGRIGGLVSGVLAGFLVNTASGGDSGLGAGL